MGDPLYEFSADDARLDRARVHELLVAHTTWAAQRTRAQQDAVVAASRNYGMYDTATGEQVAYARVVTDAVTFAWLADVVVDPAHRRRGLARALVDGLLADLAPLALTRIVLKASAEGMPLYASAGWSAVDKPEAWMQRGST